MEIFCSIMNVFLVPFDQLNAALINKSVHFFSVCFKHCLEVQKNRIDLKLEILCNIINLLTVTSEQYQNLISN